ncbi:hypothetical protein D9M71_240560 [compost metagenome]
MSEQTHILEELRSLRSAHVDLMTKMSDLCGDVRQLVTELGHTQKSYDTAHLRIIDMEKQIKLVQLENATNKPILDIAKSMYRSQWMTILAAIGAVIGSNWQKLL